MKNKELHDKIDRILPLDPDIADDVPLPVQEILRHQALDKLVEQMQARFFLHDARPRPTLTMGHRRALLTWAVLRFVAFRLGRLIPYRYLGGLHGWIDRWGARSGLWQALAIYQPEPMRQVVRGGGGFLIPYEVSKEIFRSSDSTFLRYWEMEKEDLAILIRDLEENPWNAKRS